ncbi:MAG: hypothetical protein KDB05_27650, partial [Planctomycetales bacterium]|nr:hypothetical protein [Planctomycetales bacterium]
SYLMTFAFTILLAATGIHGEEDSEDNYRTWTDSTGNFTVVASFEKFEDGKVHLKRKDNDQVIALPAAKLSKADQTFYRKLLADRAKAARDGVVSERTATGNAAETKADDKPMSWQGTWNNRKYGTDGPLKCTAKAKDANTWEAKFEGTGLGKPFTYEATMTTTKRGERTLLQGTSTVSGDQYQWTGYVEGDSLFGKYRSASGNNGEFILKEPRAQTSSNR